MREATRELQDLVSKGLLQQVGTKRWTVYRLTPAAAQSTEEEDHRVEAKSGRRWTAEERRERVFSFVKERGPLAARRIAEELGVPTITIRYDLRKLIEQGRVERTTEDPNDPRAEYHVPG
ncbi:MAG: DeoR family transcriptional regulator [Thermoguttaceae bacterium]